MFSWDKTTPFDGPENKIGDFVAVFWLISIKSNGYGEVTRRAAGVHDDGRVFWCGQFRVQFAVRRLAQTNRFAVGNNVHLIIVKLFRIDCFQRILNHDLLIHCDGLFWVKMTNFEGNQTYQDFDSRSQWQKRFEFRQKFVSSDDARDFRLVQGVNDSLLAKICDDRDEWNVLFHAAVGSDEPLGPRFGKYRHVLFWYLTELSQTSTKTFGFLSDLRKCSPLVVAKNQLAVR